MIRRWLDPLTHSPPCPAFIAPCLTQPRIVNQITLSAPSNDFINFNTIQRLKFLWLLGTFMTMTCQFTGFHNEFFKHSIIIELSVK